MVVFSWLILVLGVALLMWVIGIKGRGSFHHWVRPYRTPSCQVVGRTFPLDAPTEEISAFLVDANAFVRSKERRSNVVMRAWDHEAKTLFVGLVLQKVADLGQPEDYEVRTLKPGSFVRVSGKAKTSEITPVESLKKYLSTHPYEVDLTKSISLSGQSFQLSQWPCTNELREVGLWHRIMEATYQQRDILIFPILLTIIALGLIGTQQLILFPLGIGLIILLSGAGKFVFLHQREDESEEHHLQNY